LRAVDQVKMAAARRLLNNRDGLLSAARNSPLLLKPLLKNLGLSVTELNRGPTNNFFSKERLNIPARYSDVTIVGGATPSVHLVSELLRQGGPTIALANDDGSKTAGALKQPPKYLVVCEDWHNQDKLRATVLGQLRQVAATAKNARVLLLAVNSEGEPKDASEAARKACAIPAFEGFVRSLAKEVGANGSTVNGLVVNDGSVRSVGSRQLLDPISFFLSQDSAFVSAQTLHLTPSHRPSDGRATSSTATDAGGDRSLQGRVAVVTGAARGIGQSIAMRLYREGASVVLVDVPQAKDALEKTCSLVAAQQQATAKKGRVASLSLDISSKEAPNALHDFLLSPKWTFNNSDDGSSSEASPLSVLVHNAGITRDKLLRNMSDDRWDSVMAVNYESILRINEKLLFSQTGTTGLLSPHHGRVILLSSINGLAGARGQTNYSWTKGALSGYAKVLSEQLRSRASGAASTPDGDTASAFAVAPGFIETEMTTKIPFLMRQIGRRSNALFQGGLPEDVAATIAAFCLPGFSSASGQTLRVCGGNMVGR
jgi:3-oxoacyl-[acyl-carrier protein] reductase